MAALEQARGKRRNHAGPAAIFSGNSGESDSLFCRSDAPYDAAPAG
jgi:hypothetical protein